MEKVQPSVLKGVRERRGFGLGEVHAYTNIALSSLQAFETGNRQPSVNQLQKLASTYQVPVLEFYGRDVPDIAPPPLDFRESVATQSRISPKSLRIIDLAERVGRFLAVVVPEIGFRLNETGSQWQAGDDPERLAEFFADHINLDIADFYRGRSEYDLYKLLRAKVEHTGTAVIAAKNEADKFRGFFAKFDENAKSIFVNNVDTQVKARTFTLLHEVGHYLLDLPGISDPIDRDNDWERYCNKFSVHFLAPEREIKNLLRDAPYIRGDTERLISWVSYRSPLSRSATAIRLSELGYISEQALRTWLSSRRRSKKERTGGKASTVAERCVSKVGSVPVFAARLALRDRVVSGSDVYHALDIPLAHQDEAFRIAEQRLQEAGVV